MNGLLRRIGRLFGWVADVVFPRPPGDGEWSGLSSDEESARRKLRLRLYLFEKRGKGGTR